MGDLRARALIPIDISYEPKINSKTVQGEKTGTGAQQEGGTDKGSVVIFKEAQGGGGNGQERNRAAEFMRSLVQVELPP